MTLKPPISEFPYIWLENLFPFLSVCYMYWPVDKMLGPNLIGVLPSFAVGARRGGGGHCIVVEAAKGMPYGLACYRDLSAESFCQLWQQKKSKRVEIDIDFHFKFEERLLHLDYDPDTSACSLSPSRIQGLFYPWIWDRFSWIPVCLNSQSTNWLKSFSITIQKIQWFFKFLKFMATKTGITTNFSLFFVAPGIQDGNIRSIVNAPLSSFLTCITLTRVQRWKSQR
jgi:hypothetical protein